MNTRLLFARLLPRLLCRFPKTSKILMLGTCFTLTYTSFKCKSPLDSVNRLNHATLRLSTKNGQEQNGYCFSPGWIVTGGAVSKPVYCNGMECSVVGTFNNLTFLRCGDSLPSPFDRIAALEEIRVQIMNKRGGQLRMKDAFVVADKKGFSLLSGTGQVGDLVIQNGNPLGIITHLGMGQESGLVKMLHWEKLGAVSRHMLHPVSLMISVMGDTEGVNVTRIATNSPLAHQLKLGDLIVKVNGEPVESTQDLEDLIMMSPKQIKFTVRSGDNKSREFLLNID